VLLVRCQMPPRCPIRYVGGAAQLVPPRQALPIWAAKAIRFWAGETALRVWRAARVLRRLARFGSDVSLDYQHFYSGPSLMLAAAALGTGAVLANTSLDRNFQNWYQADVRTSARRLRKIAKEFGNGTS